jgi:hypothetical protein
MDENESFMRKKYGLTRMPFKIRVATDLELQSWINREEELEKWKKILNDALKTPTSNFLVFIIGDYGMGKTLSLLKIERELAKKDEKFYPIYLNLISEQKPKNPGLDFIFRIIRNIDFDKIKVTEENIDFIEDVFPDVGKVFRKVFFSKNEDEKRIAVPFVRGEITATQRQLKLLEVVRKIDNVDLAKEYLIGILYFLKISGFSTLVVAVDEFEYLFSLVSKSDQSIYLALLRGLYDLPIQVPDKLKNRTANMVLFIGISESGMQRLTELENIEKSTGGPINPLMRRITDKVLLNPLKKDYVRKLIEKRLSLNRVKGMYEKEPLIPFTEDYVDYIYKITGGRPSDIIVRCDHVLDVGLERRISKLTAEFAKEVFKERGFSYE